MNPDTLVAVLMVTASLVALALFLLHAAMTGDPAEAPPLAPQDTRTIAEVLRDVPERELYDRPMDDLDIAVSIGNDDWWAWFMTSRPGAGEA